MSGFNNRIIDARTHGRSRTYLVRTQAGTVKPEPITCFASYKVHTQPLLDWDVETPDGDWQTIKTYFTYSRNGGPIQRVMIDDDADDWEAVEALYAKIDTDLCRAQDGESLAFYILSDGMGLTEQVIPELNDNTIYLPPIPLPPIELNRMVMPEVPEPPTYDYTITGIGGDGLIPIPNAFNIDSRNISIPHPCSAIDFETVDWSAWPRWYPTNTIVKEDNTIVIYPSEGIEPYDFDLFRVLGGVGNIPITINSCVKAVPRKYICEASHVVGSQVGSSLILTRMAVSRGGANAQGYREPVRFSESPFPFKAIDWRGAAVSWPPNDILEGGDYGQDWIASYRRNDGPLKVIAWNTGSREPGAQHGVWDAIKELLLDDYGRTAFMLSDFNSTASSFNGDDDVTVKSGIGSNLKFTNKPSEEGEPTHLSNQSYRYSGKSVEVRDRQIQFSDENAGAVWNENTITIYPTPLEVINDYGFDGHLDYYEYLCQYYDQLEAGEPITIHSCAAVEPVDHIQVNTGFKIDMSVIGEVMPLGLIARVQINDGEIKEFANEGEFMEKTIYDLLSYVALLGAEPIVTSPLGVNNDGDAQSKTNLLYFRADMFSRESTIVGCSGIERPDDSRMELMTIDMESQRVEMLQVEILDDMDSDIPHVRTSNKVTFHKAVGSKYVDFFDLIVGAKGNTHTIYSSAGVPCLLLGNPLDGGGDGGELPDPPIDPEPIDNGFVFDLITDPTQTSVLTLIVSDPDPEWKLLRDGIVLASSNYSGHNTSVKKHSSFEEYTVQVTGLTGVDTTFSLHGSAEYVRLTTGANDYTRNKVTVTRFSDEIRRCNFSVWAMELTVPEYLPPVVDDLSSMFTSCNGFNQDISMWDVSNVTGMNEMFFGCDRFNQDLSSWCVTNIPSLPSGFDANTPAWTLPKPVWGTCPTPALEGDSFSFSTINALGQTTELPLKVNLTGTGNPWSLINVDTGDVVASEKTLGSSSGVEVGLYLDSEGATSRNYKLAGRVSKLTIALEGDSNPDGLLEVTSFSDDISEYRYNLKDADILVPTTLPSHITSLDYMFAGCLKFDQDITGWDTSNVTSMEGTFKGCYSFNQDISNWNVSNVTNMASTFAECTMFNQDLSNWNTASLTNLSHTFAGCSNFNAPLNTWDVSKVTMLVGTFAGANSFDQPLSNWNVDMVYTMRECFSSASSFNQDISAWNVERVEDMQYAFNSALSFNQDLSNWNTASLLNLEGTFKNARVFNSSIGSWNTSQVFTLSSTFQSAWAFNQPLNDWDVSNVGSMQSTFASAFAFNQPLNNWDVSNVGGSFPMYGMFEGASAFNQDLSSWCVPNVEYVTKFDEGAYSWSEPKPPWGSCGTANTEGFAFTISTADSVDPSARWSLEYPDGLPGAFKVFKDGELVASSGEANVTNVTDQYGNIALFVPENTTTTFKIQVTAPSIKVNYYTAVNKGLQKFTVDDFGVDVNRYEFAIYDADLEVPATLPSHITNMARMFKGSNRFNQDLSGWDVSSIVDAQDAFTECTTFNGNLSGWVLTSLQQASRMFSKCTSFNQPIGDWTLSDLRIAADMFSQCTSFNQDLSDWNVSTVFNFEGMFYGCTAFNKPLNSWNMSAASRLRNMFRGASSFNQPLGGWDVSGVSNMESMFEWATSFNQDISMWDTSGITRSAGMESMFANALAFNQDLSAWNVLVIPSRPYEFDSGTTATWTLPKPVWGTTGVVTTPLTIEIDNRAYADIKTFVVKVPENEELVVKINDAVVYADGVVTSDSSMSLEGDVRILYLGVPPSVVSTFVVEGTLEYLDISTNAYEDQSTIFNVLNYSDTISGYTLSVKGSLLTVPQELSPAITSTYEMFLECTNFNQDIGDWDVSNVTNMDRMFRWATNFNQDLSRWNVARFASEPDQFRFAVPNWTLPQPIWGTDGKPVIEEVLPTSLHFTTVTDVSSPTELPIELTLTPRDPSTEWQLYESGTLVASNNKQVVEGITYHTPASWKPAGSIDVRMQASGNTKSYELRGDIVRITISDRDDVTISENEHVTVHQFPTANTIVGFYTSHAGLTVPTNIPSSYTSLAGMFSGASTFNQDISMWDTSNVTDMNWMLSNADTFNQPIGNWDVSKVTDFSGMFYESYSFNQDLSQWDTSSAMNMDYMFGYASAFNQDLSGWNVVNISALPDEFDDGITGWTLPKPVWGTSGGTIVEPVSTNFRFEVDNTMNAEQRVLDINLHSSDFCDILRNGEAIYVSSPIGDPSEIVMDNTWPNRTVSIIVPANTKNTYEVRNPVVKKMVLSVNTFNNLEADINVLSFSADIPHYQFNVEAWPLTVPDSIPTTIASAYMMFYNARNFNTDISTWDVSNIANMDYMFYGTTSFNQDLSGWNVGQYTQEPAGFSTNVTDWTLPKPVWGTVGKSSEKYLPIDVTGESGVYITLSRDGVNYTTFDMTDPSFNQLAFQRFAVVGEDDNSFAFVGYPSIIAAEDLLPEDATHGLVLCGLTAEGKVITPRHPDGYAIVNGVILDPNNVDNATEISSPPLKINKVNSVIYAKATQGIPKEYDMFYSLNGAVEGGIVKVVSKATISFD